MFSVLFSTFGFMVDVLLLILLVVLLMVSIGNFKSLVIFLLSFFGGILGSGFGLIIVCLGLIVVGLGLTVICFGDLCFISFFGAIFF